MFIYLAHPISTKTERTEKDLLDLRILFGSRTTKWPQLLNVSIIDPESYKLEDSKQPALIVQRNKTDILRSGLVVAVLTDASIGTHMECHFASCNKIPVFGLVQEGSRISAWTYMHFDFITHDKELLLEKIAEFMSEEAILEKITNIIA